MTTELQCPDGCGDTSQTIWFGYNADNERGGRHCNGRTVSVFDTCRRMADAVKRRFPSYSDQPDYGICRNCDCRADSAFLFAVSSDAGALWQPLCRDCSEAFIDWVLRYV